MSCISLTSVKVGDIFYCTFLCPFEGIEQYFTIRGQCCCSTQENETLFRNLNTVHLTLARYFSANKQHITRKLLENIQLYSVSQAASYKALYLLHKLHSVEKTRGIAIYSELEREIQKGGKKKRQN